MILALRVENTNIVVGCFDGDRLRFTSRLASDRTKTGDEYAISFKNLLDIYEITPDQVEGSIIASVVPALINDIKDALRILLKKEPLVVGPGIKTGLNILTDHPNALGSDLVVNAVAAAAQYPVPLIVTDLGTATTFLAVNEKRNFVGSIIAPGAVLSVGALSEACDQLPRITFEAPGSVIGKNTVDCMKSGAVYGTASMLDGMVERIEQQLGTKCTVIGTGFYAETVVPHCKNEIILDEHLLLKGLKLIYEKNTTSKR